MTCKIINNSGLEISGFEDMIQSLVSFSQNRFGFEQPPTLFLNSDPANAENMLGKTAYYDPQQKEIHVYTTDRHPKDIMRSISHELIHHKQNCEGKLMGNHYSGQGYAQKDPHMRKMEQEAYLKGNMCFRDWEDRHKKLKEQVYNKWRTKTMSLKEWKNKELFGLLSDKWGFGKNTITEAKEDDPNRPDAFLKKQLEDAGIDTAAMSAKEIDEKAADLRLGDPKKYTALSEDKEITHMCALKVTHKESGQVGHPIKHTLTESGEISHYTVEFDEVIVENIAVENLDIMVQEMHRHKRDDKKPHNEEKEIVDEEKLEMVDCGDKGRVPKYACDGEGANDLKEGEVELEESAYGDTYRRRDELERKKDRTPQEDEELRQLQKYVQEEQLEESAYGDTYRRRDELERKKDRTPEEDEELRQLQKYVQEEQLQEIKRRFSKLIK